MSENVHDLVKILMIAAKNPITKLNGVPVKLNHSDNLEKETQSVNDQLIEVENALKFPCVNRRTCQSSGEFLESERLVKLSKGGIKNVGFRNKSGFYLHLEEALHLLETNRLEILWNGSQMSIKQAYNVFFDETLTCRKYRVYKELVNNGCKLVKKVKDNSLTNKRNIINDEINYPPIKRFKSDEEHGEKEIASSETAASNNDIVYYETKAMYAEAQKQKIIEKVKTHLKQSAPKEFTGKIKADAEFVVHGAANQIFDLHIVEDKEMDPRICIAEGKNPNLYCIFPENDIAFYRIEKVNLPDL